jgi:hypothetical protein
MAGTATFTLRDCTVTFEDAGGSTLTVGPGPGNFQHGATNAENAERLRVLNRGAFYAGEKGDDLEQEWSIDVLMVDQSLTDAAADRINDWIMKRNKFSGLTSTDPNPNVWSFKVRLSFSKGGATASKLLPVCYGSSSFAEAKEGGVISISGTNNGTILET